MPDPNDIRCSECHRKLAEYLYGTAVFTCQRCKKRIYIDTVHNTSSYLMLLTENQENGKVPIPHPV
jgi:DNA-directed RNA polymerase subunit RPC12/RpoP